MRHLSKTAYVGKPNSYNYKLVEKERRTILKRRMKILFMRREQLAN